MLLVVLQEMLMDHLLCTKHWAGLWRLEISKTRTSSLEDAGEEVDSQTPHFTPRACATCRNTQKREQLCLHGIFWEKHVLFWESLHSAGDA